MNKSEYDHRSRVVPKFLAQQSKDQPQFYGTMAEEIHRGKMPCAYGYVLCRMQRVIRDEVARVFSQFPLRQHGDNIENELLRDDVSENAADDFEDCECALEEQAHLKN